MLRFQELAIKHIYILTISPSLVCELLRSQRQPNGESQGSDAPIVPPLVLRVRDACVKLAHVSYVDGRLLLPRGAGLDITSNLYSCSRPPREVSQLHCHNLDSSGFCPQTTSCFTNTAVTGMPLRCHLLTLIARDGESGCLPAIPPSFPVSYTTSLPCLFEPLAEGIHLGDKALGEYWRGS